MDSAPFRPSAFSIRWPIAAWCWPLHTSGAAAKRARPGIRPLQDHQAEHVEGFYFLRRISGGQGLHQSVQAGLHRPERRRHPHQPGHHRPAGPVWGGAVQCRVRERDADGVHAQRPAQHPGIRHGEGSRRVPGVIRDGRRPACPAGREISGGIGRGRLERPARGSWETGKFIAAVQAATTSGRPVLMKVNYDNGHFTEEKTVTFKDTAGQFAFLLWQTGHKDFQPVK